MNKKYYIILGIIAGLGFFIVGFDHGHIFEFPDLYIHEITHDMRHPTDIDCNKICSDWQEIIIDENKGGNDYGITTGYGFSYSEYPTTRNLDAVIQSCERWERAVAVNFTSPDGTKYAIAGVGHEWFNSTHYTDNGICDFIPMKEHIENSIIRSILEYCGSSHKLSYDNPYEHWFANETHYIDADTCLWQILDDDIALVLPDNWENVYDFGELKNEK